MAKIDNDMDLMVHAACARGIKTHSIERNGHTLECRYYDELNGIATKGISGFVFTLDKIVISRSEARRFIQQR